MDFGGEECGRHHLPFSRKVLLDTATGPILSSSVFLTIVARAVSAPIAFSSLGQAGGIPVGRVSIWVELGSGLAERDAAREAGGLERYAELPAMARMELTGDFEALYAGEFYEHGLDNVRIVRPASSPHTVP